LPYQCKQSVNNDKQERSQLKENNHSNNTDILKKRNIQLFKNFNIKNLGQITYLRWLDEFRYNIAWRLLGIVYLVKHGYVSLLEELGKGMVEPSEDFDRTIITKKLSVLISCFSDSSSLKGGIQGFGAESNFYGWPPKPADAVIIKASRDDTLAFGENIL
ncbi:hypothetical protein Avbf_18164, partial [Armadillidium vulgare]